MESFSDKLKKIEPDVLGGAVSIQSVPRRQKVIQPNEALELITSRIGDVPRLNLRTRYVEIHGQAKTADDISRFYLKLDNANERWNKGLVEDVIHHIANENRFDPVSVYLHNLSKTSPLDD